MSFDPVSYAKSELAPMLEALVLLVEQDALDAEHRFFSSVLRGIEQASEAEDLVDPFMQLSMSAFSGFQLDPPVAMLLDQVLAKAQRLSEALSLEESDLH